MFQISSEGKLFHEAMQKFNRKLVTFCNQMGYECIQINGQRICTSFDGNLKPTCKGTEIFIGKIPRAIYEDELLPLFIKAGKLYQFRLMLDFSLKNRGFAFATYATAEAAEKAITLFDNYEIRARIRMGVFKSVDNCRLFFGNVPQHYNKTNIFKILKDNMIVGVVEIIMYQDLHKPQMNRGYVFVEFETHRDAAMARKQLYPGCLIVEGEAVFVDWADPIPDVDPKIMAQVTKLFIHHLPVTLSRDGLSKIIFDVVDPLCVLKVHKQTDYAFVHFRDRQSAEAAREELKKLPFPHMAIEWARPREYSKQLRLESPPTHFCLSLPPKMRRHYQQYIANLISETPPTDAQNTQKTIYLPFKSALKMPLSNQIEASRGISQKKIVFQQGEMTNSTETCSSSSLFSQWHQQCQTAPRAPTPLPPARAITQICGEEMPHRNPLIGLQMSLFPTRQETPPPPMMIQERSNYSELLYSNPGNRNIFSYQQYYNSSSLFSSGESTSLIPRLPFEFF